MARRSRALEDLLDFASRQSWPVGVVLGVVSFFALHTLATLVPATSNPGINGIVGETVVLTLIGTIARVLQFIVPPAFLIGAMASIYRRSQAITLFDDARIGGARAVDAMSWPKFERLLGEAFRRLGYDVNETGGHGSDGGIDLVVAKNDKRFLVQCKQWRARKVDVTVIRELYGVIASEGAAGGFVVTSGRFTQEARRFAQNCRVELIDGETLAQLIQEVGGTRREGLLVARVGEAQLRAMPHSVLTSKSCPECGSPMKERVAKRGRFAGQAFYGCSRYPACHATLPLS